MINPGSEPLSIALMYILRCKPSSSSEQAISNVPFARTVYLAEPMSPAIPLPRASPRQFGASRSWRRAWVRTASNHPHFTCLAYFVCLLHNTRVRYNVLSYPACATGSDCYWACRFCEELRFRSMDMAVNQEPVVGIHTHHGNAAIRMLSSISTCLCRVSFFFWRALRYR